MGPPALSTNVSVSSMDEETLRLFVVDSLIKLQCAMPRKPGDALDTFARFGSLMLNVASLLPNSDVTGLGDGQQTVVHRAFDAMMPVARAALLQPLSRLTPGMVDLLRSLARGTEARNAESGLADSALGRVGRTTEAVFSPSTVRTHRYVNYADVQEFVGGLTNAEQFYETCYAGYQRLQQLVSTEYWNVVDQTLPTLTRSMVAWAVPLMFDGLRLRRGLEVAAPCGTLTQGQRAPFGLESTAVVLLSDGETSVDRERVGRTAQFLMAAAQHGICENPPDESFYTGQGSGGSEHPAHTLSALERQLKQDLDTCRQEVETRCLVPGKSMRIILDHVARMAEYMPYSDGTTMFFQYALAYPCLVPQNLCELEGYDGGLLSVWDACNYLLRLHVQEHKEVLSFHALLCAVLGGVVGSLMSETITGPFGVHPETEVHKTIERINASWPPTSKKVRCDATDLGTGKHVQVSPRGKKVSATAAVCDTITRSVLKEPQQRTLTVDARFDGALTMHVITSSLAQLPGVFDSRPSDGIVPLKRLYFAALHLQPGTPEGRGVDYNGDPNWSTSVFADGVPAWPPGTMPVDSIEMPWREIVGGALLSTGPLFCFSRHGFLDSLQKDWKDRPPVARALEARGLSGGERAQPVMLPSEAMELMTKRAQRRVADTVTRIDNVVKSVDGPAFVTRVVEMLNAWSNMVYSSADYNPLWEVSIAHFACPTNSNKRPRSTSPI